MNEIIIKKFEISDETRIFEKGKLGLIKLKDMIIGRAIYEPAWKWSLDVSSLSGTEFCEIEHYGIFLSGTLTVAFPKEKTHLLNKGDLFFVSSDPHDSWVLGDEEYISLHSLGAEKYENNISFLYIHYAK